MDQPAVYIPPGPAKRRSGGTVERPYGTHMRRAVWFQMRATWPLREAPIAVLEEERARAAATLVPQPGAAAWELVGPTNVGGRMTCLVCDPTRPDVIWAGAAGGGVWASTDAGGTWRPLWHTQPSLNVGALAIDPRSPQTLYCGTGEANLSADSYPGVGLFRSTDAGATWSLLAPARSALIPTRIGALAVDPFNSQHIRLGGGTYSAGLPSGLFVSRDGGLTWARETFVATQEHWCHDVLFHPTKQGTLYATFTERGAHNGIWRSTNGGQTWQQLLSGLPAPEQFGRTRLAIAPSKPNVLYAQVADHREGVLGVFRSANSGDTWQNVAGTHFPKEGQMSYGNSIVVHPTNENHVLCGGVDLHRTRDGGKTWQKVTRWDAKRGDSNYAHADHHALVMPAAAPGRVYDLNDGGMDVSTDGGTKWTNRSNGLAATMYYDLDVAQSDGRVFGGGTQDNGTNITTTGRPDDHFEILGGDGGWMDIDPTNAGHLFASYYNMHIFRFAGGAWKDVSPPAPAAEAGNTWMVFITLDPANPKTVYTGSNRVWKSQNDGDTWTAVSASLDGSDITAIHVARADRRRVYVGTENGGFFRSVDAGQTWSADLRGATLPGRTITRIETDPNDAQRVYVTVANFGNSHVFGSADGGTHWQDLDRGRLPDVPHHTIAIPPSAPQTIYVASDAGVHVSNDGGQTWFDLTRNLPVVSVVDLVYHVHDKTLTAATYGRSLWRLAVP